MFEPHLPLLVIGLCVIGLIALVIAVGPAAWRVVEANSTAVLLAVGCLCLGAGAVLGARRVGAAPLGVVAAPDPAPDAPLDELESLAERTAARLRQAYRVQLAMGIAVGVVLVAVLVWAMVLVGDGRVEYAAAFGTGGLGMAVLAQWKWQPFERIGEARKLADSADVLATGLRLRMRTIAAIPDPSEREAAQWRAVSEYLDRAA